MPIKTICPHCGRTGSTPDGSAGKNAKCQGCQKVFKIEGQNPLTPPAFLPPSPPPIEPDLAPARRLPSQTTILAGLIFLTAIGVMVLVWAIISKPERDRAHQEHLAADMKQVEEEWVRFAANEAKAKQDAEVKEKADQDAREKVEREAKEEANRKKIAAKDQADKEEKARLAAEEASKPTIVDGEKIKEFVADSGEAKITISNFGIVDINKSIALVFDLKITNTTKTKNLYYNLPHKLSFDDKNKIRLSGIDEFENGLACLQLPNGPEKKKIFLPPEEKEEVTFFAFPLVKSAKKALLILKFPSDKEPMGKSYPFIISLENVPKK